MQLYGLASRVVSTGRSPGTTGRWPDSGRQLVPRSTRAIRTTSEPYSIGSTIGAAASSARRTIRASPRRLSWNGRKSGCPSCLPSLFSWMKLMRGRSKTWDTPTGVLGLSSLGSGRLAMARRLGVTYGPIGAAKTLFALRPNVCPPWDNFTLKKLGLDVSGRSYNAYVRRVRSDVRSVARQTRDNRRRSASACRTSGLDSTEAHRRVLLG